MKRKVPGKFACSMLLLAAAVVWGISFVTQSVGGDILGPYAFNSVRMLMGALVIFICTKTFSDRIGISARPDHRVKGHVKKQILVGIVCGILLAVGTNLQQVAIYMGTTTGKAGFVTALYIVLVPILGLFFRQRTGWNIWAAVVIAVAGLYFLCMKDGFSMGMADILLIGCALGFALQIIVIDRFGKGLDGLRLAGMEFLVCGIISGVMALIFEIIPYPGGFGAWIGIFVSGKLWISLLYMGIFSCGVGYTFQILGQQNLDPSLASIIMSLESVFAAISGGLILGQVLSGREYLGCVLMFAAVILAQVQFGKKNPEAESH
ncbi:MAG: DMT family transporter [Parasporobacterium sp.]|nr:DMT family transporter [Parasporobacterium sp.]